MTFCIFFSGIATALVFLFGKFDIALQTLLVFLVLSYVTELLFAKYENKLNVQVGINGVIKKVGYLVLVILVTMLDKMLSDTGYIRTPVLYFLVANEGISILKRWGKMGLPIPNILINRLEILEKKDMNGE